MADRTAESRCVTARCRMDHRAATKFQCALLAFVSIYGTGLFTEVVYRLCVIYVPFTVYNFMYTAAF